MRILFVIIAAFVVVNASAQHDHQKTAPTDTTKKSIPKEVHTEIGDAHIMIFYTAPTVRGRVIWGGLVPFDEVWVTGAHKATTWEFSSSIEINKIVIPAGKYAIFTIPRKEKWTFILNKKWDQHLADEYNAKEDVLRLEVSHEILKDTQERLLYSLVEGENNQGVLSIRWEKLKISVPFQVR
ncbi:MAG TPA: DUF2911 domain-containing protein [Cyclobacteriaceae bacterium]|jgi:hypothetical protein|nr:DUF2911 domain-containing protein [Cyclobacteriaceae bacterium]